MPLNDNAINEILPFAAEGLEAAGDLLTLEEYKAHTMRLRGHMPGLALRGLQNRASRQSAHVAAGLAQFIANRYTPGVVDDGDLDKIEQGLLDVISALIAEAMPVVPDKYDIGQYHWFEDEMPRTGMFPLIGGWVENFSRYTKAVEYFETVWGQRRLVTLEEYDRRHTAIWAALANGDTVGWNNEGGANCFVWDKPNDRMRIDGLAGMSREQVSAALGVGGVQGDGIPDITGTLAGVYGNEGTGAFGPPSAYANSFNAFPNAQIFFSTTFKASNVVPTAAKNQTRSWGSLACVYLGKPAS